MVDWFVKEHSESFKLYGNGWKRFEKNLSYQNKKSFQKSYQGFVPDKIKPTSRAKFIIAYENAFEPGYISEKIFDAMKAGGVPVYFGAPDIEKYVPENCFINGSKFETQEDLYHYLKTIPDETYQNYIRHIRSFIQNFNKTPFDSDFVFRRITNIIFENQKDLW